VRKGGIERTIEVGKGEAVISDVLAEAIEEIQHYRTDPVFRGTYPADWPAMDNLLAEMDAMRIDLDSPTFPTGGDHECALRQRRSHDF
jgi:hypothetical protein